MDGEPQTIVQGGYPCRHLHSSRGKQRVIVVKVHICVKMSMSCVIYSVLVSCVTATIISLYTYCNLLLQDVPLNKFFRTFLNHQFDVGSEQEEKDLLNRIIGLQSAAPEPLVHFLYPILNGLFSLFVRPTLSEEAALVQQNGFSTIAYIAKRMQTELDLPFDKHGHNMLLESYLQHVFVAPIGPPPQGSSKDKRATMGGHGSNTAEEEVTRRTTSLRLSSDTKLQTSNSSML